MSDKKDGISLWMDSAARYPLLPKAEVIRIATIIQDPDVSEKMRTTSVQKLVRHNLRLIPKVVRRVINNKRSYAHNSPYVEDMLQCGVVGLKRAAELYNPKTGYMFSTYAMPWIYQAVQRFAYNNLSQIRVPENTIRDLYKHIDENKYKFNLSSPVDFRLSSALRALYGCMSADAPVKNNNDPSTQKIIDTIPDPYVDRRRHDAVDELLEGANLSKLQLSIVDMVYRQNMTKAEAAEMIGVSFEKIKTEHHKAIKAIRANIS